MRALQRTIGNRALGALLRAEPTARTLARCGPGGCTCGGACKPADELADDEQRRRLSRTPRTLARTVTYDSCSSSQETTILAAHNRANALLDNALAKLVAYDGTDPPEVHTALRRHFNSTSTFVAGIVATNIRNLKREMRWSFDPQYECQAEDDGNVLAWVPWCIPLADIEVYPLWFAASADERAGTLVHEWFHKYGCKLDVGYDHEEGYEGHSTLRHLLNADSFGEFVYDVR